MRQSRVEVTLDRHTGFLQSLLHHLSIISQRISLARADVRWRKVLMVLGIQSHEGVSVLGVSAESRVECLHGRFVDDGHVGRVLGICFVHVGVFRGDIVPMERGGDDGDTAGNMRADLGLCDDEVGKSEGECATCGAADGEEFGLIAANR